MDLFLRLIPGFWQDLIDEFGKYTIEINGISVSLPAIWFAALVIGLVITIFWKGSRT